MSKAVEDFKNNIERQRRFACKVISPKRTYLNAFCFKIYQNKLYLHTYVNLPLLPLFPLSFQLKELYLPPITPIWPKFFWLKSLRNDFHRRQKIHEEWTLPERFFVSETRALSSVPGGEFDFVPSSSPFPLHPTTLRSHELAANSSRYPYLPRSLYANLFPFEDIELAFF